MPMGNATKRGILAAAADQIITELREEAIKENGKKFFNSKELADRWRLSEQTLANWRSAGKGPPYIRVGNRVLYPIEGIHSFEKLSSSWLSSDNSQATSAETPS